MLPKRSLRVEPHPEQLMLVAAPLQTRTAPSRPWRGQAGDDRSRPEAWLLADDLIEGVLKLLNKGLGEESGNHGRKQHRFGADGTSRSG